jgi:hypothetical protein
MREEGTAVLRKPEKYDRIEHYLQTYTTPVARNRIRSILVGEGPDRIGNVSRLRCAKG